MAYKWDDADVIEREIKRSAGLRDVAKGEGGGRAVGREDQSFGFPANADSIDPVSYEGLRDEAGAADRFDSKELLGIIKSDDTHIEIELIEKSGCCSK